MNVQNCATYGNYMQVSKKTLSEGESAHRERREGWQTTRGFTLIEILVAIVLFTVIMTASVGALISINDANRRTQAIRAAIDNVNFAVDSMTRRLRTGTGYHCLSGTESDVFTEAPAPKDCSNPSGNTRIVFKAADSVSGITNLGDIVTYRLVEDRDGLGRIEVRSTESDASVQGEYRAMTATEVDIETLRFIVVGAEATGSTQPYVLVTVRGRVGTGDFRTVKSGALEEISTPFTIQTTVSQRLLNR